MRYKESGVDEAKIAQLVDYVKKKIYIPPEAQLLEGIGGFAAVLQVDAQRCLVACADGVGTKIELYLKWGNSRGAGWDCVAMCVDDLVTTGARPFAFLDYFASSSIQPEVFQEVMEGLQEACILCRMALIGGETAEMPGFYSGALFDLVGFALGWVEKNNWLQPQKTIKSGNILLGLPSSGLHANGFSLIRRILAEKLISLDEIFAEEGKPFGEIFTRRTKIYTPFLLRALDEFPRTVLGMAHITGGGISDNILRVLPAQAKAVLHKSGYNIPPIFSWIQKTGEVPEEEMWNTFNMGVGMILFCEESGAQKILSWAKQQGEVLIPLGEIQEGNREIQWK